MVSQQQHLPAYVAEYMYAVVPVVISGLLTKRGSPYTVTNLHATAVRSARFILFAHQMIAENHARLRIMREIRLAPLLTKTQFLLAWVLQSVS